MEEPTPYLDGPTMTKEKATMKGSQSYLTQYLSKRHEKTGNKTKTLSIPELTPTNLSM